MTSKIFFFAGIIFLTVLSPKQLFSQTQVSSSDSVKTVALYSSKKSFFKDYPIDTLVSHLNYLNQNSKIIFCKNTEDHSKTGFYANFVIDLDVFLKEPVTTAPTWQSHPTARAQTVAVPQADGTTKYETIYIEGYQETGNNGTTSPGEGEVRIKMIEKRKNEKKTSLILSAFNSAEQDLKFILIIKLIQYLLDHFSK